MLIKPAASPWCRPLASAESLSIATAGAKHSPAPTDSIRASPHCATTRPASTRWRRGPAVDVRVASASRVVVEPSAERKAGNTPKNRGVSSPSRTVERDVFGARQRVARERQEQADQHPRQHEARDRAA